MVVLAGMGTLILPAGLPVLRSAMKILFCLLIRGLYEYRNASSASPYGSLSTTTPPQGKNNPKKDIMKILAHINPLCRYGYGCLPRGFNCQDEGSWRQGLSFSACLTLCPPGWGSPQKNYCTIPSGCCPLFPLRGGKWGKYIINYKPQEYMPVREYLKGSGVFQRMKDKLI